MAAQSNSFETDIVGYNEDLLEFLNFMEPTQVSDHKWIKNVIKNEQKYSENFCHCLMYLKMNHKNFTNKNLKKRLNKIYQK